jgi:hypothetical protein
MHQRFALISPGTNHHLTLNTQIQAKQIDFPASGMIPLDTNTTTDKGLLNLPQITAISSQCR